jgi:hypothetical protein
MTNFASFGSCSHGTMRAIDLVEAFANELEYHIQRNASEWCSDTGRTARDNLVELVGNSRNWLDTDDEEQTADWEDAGNSLIEELFGALQQFAPPYAYFGEHPGNGSDYGFWLSENFEHEFDGLKVADLSEVPGDFAESVKSGHATGEVALINDHGNITLYTMIENGQLCEVWALV